MFGGVGSDLRHSTRLLWKSRGFTAVTLLTLALCIGATTAIFSMVYSLMLKPLPFAEPERIVEVYASAKKAGLNKLGSNVVMFLDYGKNSASYEALALWTNATLMVGEDGAAERLFAARATADIFPLLRLRPVLGRFFTKEHNRPGEDKVVVLTQSYWQTRYAENPDVIDQTMRIEGETYRIIGVAPRVFEAFDARVKFVAPMAWGPDAENPQRRYGFSVRMFGRLQPSIAVGQADAEAKTIEKRAYDQALPGVRQFLDRSGLTMNVGGQQAERVEPVRVTLYLLQGGVAFVLLIGCVNVANLLLARSNGRQSELAIRFALGASRGVIARNLLLESLLLTGLGALLGVALAWGALRVINHYTAEMLPYALPMALDYRVLTFAVALAVVVGMAIGLVPILHLFNTNLSEVINRTSRGSSAGRGVRTLSSALVVMQVAVALVLLTGAGLLIHSFANALEVDPGFERKNVVTARVALPSAHRASDDAAKNIQERLLAGMREIPGVSSAALSFATPFQGGLPINALNLAEDTLPAGAPQPGAFRVAVSSGYLDTLKLRLVEGRFYEESDRAPGRRHFVVDESFAKRFFPGRSALGGRFAFGGRPEKPEDWPTIIGVVRDVPHNGVEEKSGNPFVYQLISGGRPGGLTLFLRAERPAADVLAELRAKVRAIDPAIALFDAGTLDAAVDSSFDRRRAVMWLLTAFAGLALFLSALGIYGVLAYDVSQRTREIGIRGAIGASRRQVIGMVLKQGLWKAGIGLAIGIVGAWLLSRYMTSLLFEVRPTEPVVYAGVSILLLLVAVLASYLPARRAAKIDPMVALRDE